MKRVFFLLLVSLLLAAPAMSQTRVTKDKNGNFVTLTTESSKTPVKKETGKSLKLKTGEKLPVYEGAKGALFVERTSKKTGKVYRQYLKEEK